MRMIFMEVLGVLMNFSSFLILGVLFQQITKNKLTLGEWIFGILFIQIFSLGLAYSFVYRFNIAVLITKDVAPAACLMLISYHHNPRISFRYHLFYALYPINVHIILQRVYAYLLMMLFSIEITPRFDTAPIVTIIATIIAIFIPPVLYYLISKWLNIDISNVRKTLKNYLSSGVLTIVNILMVVYYFGNDYLALEVPSDSPILKIIVRTGAFIYLFLLFAFLFYLNFRHGQEQKNELLRNQEMELKALENYSKHVESLYQEVRSFRHDYANVLMSLKVGIDQGDLDNIKKIYEEITVDSAKLVKNNKFDLTRLANISDSAVKSLMSAKFLEAENRSIEISLEVSEPMKNPAIPLISYIRILSILFDNAIEGALESENPKIAVANFYQDGDFVFIIENSTREKSVDLSKIFQCGYSTKGENRGLGLATLVDFQDDYENLSVETSSSDYTFTQVVRVYEGEIKCS
ncbi:sensor histidine kinase [Streptococcus equinus]|uniref:sensor histidine kinase n=1 Tax=Streptococcus equinus TaxID=1335 RepID=UPI0037D19ABA